MLIKDLNFQTDANKRAIIKMIEPERSAVNYSSNNNNHGDEHLEDIKLEQDSQLTEAWVKYREFEEYTNSQSSPLPLSEFISEWSARLNSAVVAGCEYSDTVLAFKLLDRVNLDQRAVRQILVRYRCRQ